MNIMLENAEVQFLGAMWLWGAVFIITEKPSSMKPVTKMILNTLNVFMHKAENHS